MDWTPVATSDATLTVAVSVAEGSGMCTLEYAEPEYAIPVRFERPGAQPVRLVGGMLMW